MKYSTDFRKKVLKVKEHKALTIQETATHFDIGTATVSRWLRGSPLSGQGVTRKRKIDKTALLLDVEKNPQSYISERAVRFKVSNKAIWQALRKLGISHKKNATPPQS
ncbi:MAG: IS630 transposase-related protein [Alphaproteobacteria bacterium]